MTSLFEAMARDIEATLDLDQALLRFCRNMSHALPVGGAFIGKHLPNSRKVIFVGRADLQESRPMHAPLPIPDSVQRYLVSAQRPEARAYALSDFPAMLRINKSVIPTDRSYMEIRLRAGATPIGMIGMYSARGRKFEEEAVRLALDVRRPMAQALAVHLLKKGLFSLPGEMILGFEDGDETAEREHDMAPTVSPAMQKLLQRVETVAPLPHTVLLLGETGVGKEVIARRLHERSPRRQGPLIHVNCGALPELLVDSELFGHEKGAFTGAEFQRPGLFEQAHGGTIFLDEIGELPLSAQTRLLLTLQDKTVYRVGGRQRIPLDFRVVVATNRNLAQMAAADTFRRDLYYRLNALTLHVPPLRERREDIPALALHFMKKTAKHLGYIDIPEVPEAMLAQWMAYDWPGNVRELSNRVEQLLIFGSDGDDLQAVSHAVDDGDFSLQRHTRAHIQRALDQAHGRVAGEGGAAELLSLHPSTLRSRMKKLGIAYGRRRKRMPEL